MKMLFRLLVITSVVTACAFPALAAAKKSPAALAATSAPAADVGRSGSPATYAATEHPSADGALVLRVADRVEQGGVLLARLRTREAVPTFAVIWGEKTYSLPAQPGLAGGAEAEVLLPVPVDASAGKPLQLEVRAGKSRVTVPVRVRQVNWPRQEITVENKYVTPPKELGERIAREREKVNNILGTVSTETRWSTPFARPVPGEPSSVFGGKRVFNGQPRSMHRGVDLRGATGTPILALAAGRVALAEEQYFSGNVVYLDHGQGFVTLYAHLSAFNVREGDFVEAGQQLGLVGATGRVTGPHLHLGALLRGQAVNPLALLGLE